MVALGNSDGSKGMPGSTSDSVWQFGMGRRRPNREGDGGRRTRVSFLLFWKLITFIINLNILIKVSTISRQKSQVSSHRWPFLISSPSPSSSCLPWFPSPTLTFLLHFGGLFTLFKTKRKTDKEKLSRFFHFPFLSDLFRNSTTHRQKPRCSSVYLPVTLKQLTVLIFPISFRTCY